MQETQEQVKKLGVTYDKKILTNNKRNFE